ncbi:MAG TPA: hypothetical protein VNY05_41705 [Candidatus Acidoferrales bacterium]|nr:hypothetical protein [Candidatus Acidoferrales bacterium]
MKRAVSLSLAATVWIGCARDARAQFPHVNRKLTARGVTIHKAVLLPAQVTVNKIGVKGAEGGVPQAEQIGGSFYSAVSTELALRGIEVLPNPLEQAKDDAARYAIADLQARYDNVGVQVRRRPGSVEKGRFTLGDGVAKFEPGAAADILVFIRGTGHVLTSARKAIGLAEWNWIGMGRMSQFRGEVTFVDAKTGEVLALIRFARGRDMTVKSGERFSQSLREALHDVPLPLPPPKG